MIDKRRKSTKIRHNYVHSVNRELIAELGNRVYWSMNKFTIYEMISERTGLSVRRIQHILNHTQLSSIP